MKRHLFAVLFLCAGIQFTLAQEPCSFGTTSEETANGSNISTGGNFEYYIASDFDIPFGTLLTVDQLQFNVLKGSADLSYVNFTLLEDDAGMPGEALHTFENQIPSAQEFAYTTGIPDMDAYQITLDLPPFDLPTGKYYIQLQGAPGDEIAVSWELINEETTSLGRFDFSQFENDGWFGGFAYYDHVFEISGICTTVAEEPYYGETCNQANESNAYETGVNFVGLSLADDFIVQENTTFFLKNIKISTLQLGNIVRANINIRNSENGTPGDVIYSVENKGPKTENFYGYHPLDGYPLDVVAVDVEFEFEEPFELEAGNYFIEFQVTPFPLTDVLTWEATSLAGIGEHAFSSNDGGQTWDQFNDYNLVFDVSGYCSENLGTPDFSKPALSYYPNPVIDALHIDTEVGITRLSIYNAIGQKVYHTYSNTNNISLESLPSGLYFIETHLEDGSVNTFKIVKK